MIESTFTTDSTLDKTQGLLSKYAYVEGKTNMPIVVLIHGFNLNIDAITDSILRRIANQGYFAVAIGMRGRKGATGRRDASIRELHDIYDGINFIKSHFSVSNKVIVSGYSGGGGNALAFAVKFPYVANTIVNHFGMADYGYDNIESWFVRNPSYQSDIINFVGYQRTTPYMNYYRSRNAYESLKNVQAKIYSYHDQDDTGVSVRLTEYLTAELARLSKAHETHISKSTDNVRYYHEMGSSAKTEGDWLPYGLTANKPTMPQTGSLRVTGYIVTDKFKVLLGTLDNHVADVNYNLSNKQFTVTPLTGTMQITVQMDNLQQILTVDKATTFIFDGEEIPEEPIGVARDIKKTFIKKNGVFVPVKKVYFKRDSKWVETH